MLSADWTTKIITVPQSDLTLVEGTRYTITVDFWFSLLAELNGSDQGVVQTVNAPLYENTSPTTTTPRITDVINGYTVVFELGLYSVEFVDGNTNIREVEIKNTVSVGTNNTSALINPTVLEASVFAGQVVVDVVNGVTGVGKTPDGELIGTFRAPSSLMADSISIANTNGIKNFLLSSSITINEDLSNSFNMIGSSPQHLITVNPAADLSGASFMNLSVEGELDGLNSLTRCLLKTVTNVSGFMEKCALKEEIHINGDILVMESYSNFEGSGYPTLHGSAGNTIELRDFHGSIGIADVVDGSHSIEIDNGGRYVVEASCVGGTIHLRGSGFEIVDNSGAGCEVLDERSISTSGGSGGGLTDNQDTKLTELHQREGLVSGIPLVSDNNAGTITAGDIVLQITGDGINQSTATRVPVAVSNIVDESGNFISDENGNHLVG